ncbi:hypothetical protein SprV_0602192800 [Sparganum proliferum]
MRSRIHMDHTGSFYKKMILDVVNARSKLLDVFGSNHIAATSTALKRHAESRLETVTAGIEELQRNLGQRAAALDRLENCERLAFENYVQTVRGERVEARWTKLLRSVEPVKAQTTLPNNPERKLLQRPTPTGASYRRGSGYTASQSSAMLSEDSDTGALSSVANADPTS